MDTVSVHDHEAFAARHLPDLSHGVKDFQVYTWRLTNWKKLEQRITSPEFDCGGHKWRILLFPFGNSNSSSNDTVSVYLDYAEPNKSPPGRHACAQFALVISNVHDPTIYTVSHAQHRFIADECDWGFTRFSELRKLFNIQKGHLRPTIEETSADVTVFVRVVEDPTGVLWHEEPPQHEAKRREREEQHLFLTARVITDDTFARHEGFDLVTFDEKNSPQSVLPTFRVLKQETYSTFKSRVAAHFGIPDNKVRLWVLVSRQNKTMRPHMHIPEDKASLTVEMIRNNMAARRNDLRLYLDVITYPSKPDPPPGYSIVFLKHFDTSKQTLHGVGKVYVSRNSKVEDLHPIIHERMRWTPGTPLRLYEEIRPGMIRSMKPKLTFSQSEIQNGDVICFQVKQEKKELRYLDNQGLYSNPSDFYDFLQNRVTIIFRPKFEEPDNDHPEFSLVLSKKHNYDTMSQRAAKHLRHDHSKLRFTTTDAANGHPKAILRQSANQSIADIVGSSCVNTTTTVILYEKRDTHDQGSARLSTVSPRPVCTKLPRGTHTGPEHPASPCTSVDSCSSSLRATAGEEVPPTLVADSPPSPPSEANKPPQPSRTTLSGAGTSRVVDEVVEAIRQDKDLDPHQERLLGCIVDPSSISTTFAHVHLPPHTIDSVCTLVSLPLLYPAAFQTGILREHAVAGCLLFGPPGTGKTLIVRALAKEAGSRMLMVSPSDVMDMYVGEGEKLVRAVFSLARRLSPCVVFLDEIDALFGARTSARRSGGVIAHRGVITEFMQEMDGLKSRTGKERVIVIGATNRPFDLDDAVLRRLPRRLLVDLPGEKEREGIMKILLRDETLSPDLDLQSLAKQTESFSGSDLKHLCVSAALAAVKESVILPWATSLDAQSISTNNEPPNLSDMTEAQPLSCSRVIHPRHFTKAFKEITPSASESLGSLTALRKWNEQFGEGRKDERRLQV